MRKYILSERSSLFEPDIYISMVVKLSGNVEKEKLIAAVKAAYNANETTMSRIVLTDKGDAFYERMEESGCRVFMDSRSWKEILHGEEKKTFHIDEGELIRSFITPEKDGITLYIMAHHLAGDGKSMVVLIEDIMRAMEGQTLIYKEARVFHREYLNKKGKLPLLVKAFIKSKNRKWNIEGRIFTWKDYYAVHDKYWKNHSSKVEIRALDEKELENLKMEAHKNQVTINSYLVAQLQREFPEKSVIGIPVSVRDGDMSMSNQTSGISIRHSYRSTRSLSENAREIHEKIYSIIKNKRKKYFVLSFLATLAPTITDGVILHSQGYYKSDFTEKMLDTMKYRGKSKTQLGVTNLSRIDLKKAYSTFKIEDILFIPPKVSYSEMVVGVSTFSNRLSCSIRRS